MIRILHLEDNATDHQLIAARLRAEHLPCAFTRVDTEAQFRAALAAGHPDLILADYRLPTFDGRTALRIAQQHCPDVPFIVLSGAIGETAAVEILQAGATDYLLKDRDERLVPAIQRALAEAESRRARQAAEQARRVSEAHLEDFFENATIGLHWVGPDGIILRANKAELALLGYAHEEYVGQPVADFHVDRAVIDDIFSRLLNGEPVREQEARLRCKDGSVKHVRIASSALFDDSGRFVHSRCFTQDITARKQAEAEVRTRLEENAALLDALPAYVWTCLDEDSRLITGNRAGNELTGVTPGTNISQTAVTGGQAVYLRQLKDDGTEYRPDELPIQQAIATGQPVRDVQLDFRFADGRRVQTLGTAVPLFDAAGRPRGAIAAFIDITARKQAERALRESEEHFRRLFESIDQAFCVIELVLDARQQAVDFRFVQVSPSFEKLTGISDARGRNVSTVFANFDPTWAEIFGDVLHSGQAVQFERYSPELERWLELRAYRVGAPDRREVAVLFSDVSERRNAADVLQRNQALFSTIIDQAPGGVYAVDDRFRMMQINALARPVFANAEPVIGRDFGEVIRILWGEEVGAQVAAIFRRTLDTGERYVSPRFTHTRADLGAEQSYEWEVQRVTLPNGRHGVVCYFSDVTERLRDAAALLSAKEAAEAANRAKDRFLAALSHELRTPLTPVLMTVAALEHAPGLRAEVRAELAMIRRNIQLETKLIDDLLDVSRITSGKVALRPTPVDLHEAVAQACEICQPQLREQGVRLEFAPAGAALQITADAARLQQVLWNVLKNAIKFTSAPGTVRVSTAALGGDRCEVRVSDTGIGIAPELLPKIFGAFEQGDPRITHEFGGLGLGLAISRALVELHGGAIRAESAGRGRGATFVIELPVSSGAAVAAAPERGAPERGALRLLVVEDHANTARVLGLLLAKAGYAVRLAANVAGALDLAQRETFDLLITDIGLPDGTGYDVMAGLKAIQPLAGIVMSGYGMDEDLKRSTAAGFIEHVVKPFEGPELLAAIARAAERRP